MAKAAQTALKPRKRPAQSRSKVTVDAIFEATIQVLLADGLQQLTTTRVAERAGVSVGTLYQYYPHKQSLLYAVLERHLTRISEAVAAAAQACHGQQKAEMVRHLVKAFVDAKMANVDEARALYAVASELDSRELVVEAGHRCTAALAALLATAPDQTFRTPELTAFYLFSAMTGPTRAMLEASANPAMLETLSTHLEWLCLGYLDQLAASR